MFAGLPREAVKKIFDVLEPHSVPPSIPLFKYTPLIPLGSSSKPFRSVFLEKLLHEPTFHDQPHWATFVSLFEAKGDYVKRLHLDWMVSREDVLKVLQACAGVEALDLQIQHLITPEWVEGFSKLPLKSLRRVEISAAGLRVDHWGCFLEHLPRTVPCIALREAKQSHIQLLAQSVSWLEEFSFELSREVYWDGDGGDGLGRTLEMLVERNSNLEKLIPLKELGRYSNKDWEVLLVCHQLKKLDFGGVVLSLEDEDLMNFQFMSCFSFLQILKNFKNPIKWRICSDKYPALHNTIIKEHDIYYLEVSVGMVLSQLVVYLAPIQESNKNHFLKSFSFPFPINFKITHDPGSILFVNSFLRRCCNLQELHVSLSFLTLIEDTLPSVTSLLLEHYRPNDLDEHNKVLLKWFPQLYVFSLNINYTNSFWGDKQIIESWGGDAPPYVNLNYCSRVNSDDEVYSIESFFIRIRKAWTRSKVKYHISKGIDVID